jgi:hypothetical protein
MPTEADEGGIRPQRIEFIRETERGTTPADPDWELYSDAIQSFSWTPDASAERQDAVGNYLPVGFFSNNESHELNVTYHLQRWLVDGSGNSVDAANDGISRNSDNQVKNTHSIVAREEHSEAGGTADSGRRIYVVVKGGRVETVEFPFTTDRSLPIEVSLDYMAEKARAYNVSQPSSSTTLDVVSSDSSDTTQTLTIEDEGAGTTEDVSLNGTTTVPTSAPFADIDAAELDAECAGDVTIEDGSGNVLLTIYGQDSYEHGEGDLGIPALGGGSHASALGTDYEIFSGDTFQATTGSLGGTGARVISGSMTVSNNMGSDAQVGTSRRYIYAQDQTLEVGAEVAGPESNVTQIRQHLQSDTFVLEWTADGGTITFTGGEMMDAGEVVKEANAARNSLDQTFEFSGITIST